MSNDLKNSRLNKPSFEIQQSNQRLFEEFKTQYDQLRQTYEAQRVSFDEVVQEKKRLEIQILNHNGEFYEK